MSRTNKGINARVKPPVLPDIPSGIPSQLRPLLAGIRENLQLLNWGLSVKGDVIKLQQQVSSLTQITVNLSGVPIATPTDVVGVHVAALSSVIAVDWFYPSYDGHHYTEIFVQQSKATDGLPDDAPEFNENMLWQVSLSAGASIPVAIQAHAGVYIWLRHVNKKGDVGPLYTHGFVIIPMSASVILEIVGDSIDWSNLNPETQRTVTDIEDDVLALSILSDKHGKLITDLDSSTASALAQAEKKLELADSDIEKAIVESEKRLVIADGVIDKALLDAEARLDEADSLTNRKINTVERNLTTDISDTNIKLENSEVTLVAADLAMTKRVDLVETNLTTDISATNVKLEQTEQTLITADKAITKRVDLVETNLTTDISATNVKLEQTEQTLITADLAMTKRVDLVETNLTTDISATNVKLEKTEQTLITADTAMTKRVDLVETNLTTDISATNIKLEQTEQTLITADAAITKRVDLVETNLTTDISATNVKLEQTEQTLVAADKAMTKRVDLVETNLTTDISATNVKLEQTEQTLVTADTAITKRVDLVETNLTTDIAAANTKINSVEHTLLTADTAMTKRVDTMESGFTTDISNANTRIESVNTTLTKADSAAAQKHNKLQADFNTDKNGESSRIQAKINSYDTVLTSPAGAIAQAITDYSVTVDGLTYSISDTTYTSVTAKKTADSATSTANTANSKADGATSAANTAQTTADSAKNAATSAEKAAADAKKKADAAESTAKAANTLSNNANTLATSANTTSNTANTTSNTANNKANTAVSTANSANTLATSAKSIAGTANTTSNTANNKANTAVSTANSANTTSNTANTKSNTAVSTANTAKSTADAVNKDFTAMWDKNINTPTGIKGTIGLYRYGGKTSFVVKADDIIFCSYNGKVFNPFVFNTTTGELYSNAIVSNKLHIGNTASIYNGVALFDAKTFAVRDTSDGGTDFTMALTRSNIDGVTKNRVHMNDVVIGDARIENVKVTGKKHANGSYSTELTNVHVLGDSKFSGEVAITSGEITIGKFSLDANGNMKTTAVDITSGSLRGDIISESGSIRSRNYKANRTGWKLHPNGMGEFNNFIKSKGQQVWLHSHRIYSGTHNFVGRYDDPQEWWHEVNLGFIDTGMPISAWNGGNGYSIVAHAEFASGSGFGTWWGNRWFKTCWYSLEVRRVRQVTRWTGPHTLQVEVVLWHHGCKFAQNVVANIRVYKV